MIRETYKRYLQSNRTFIIITAVMIITGISYYFTYSLKMELLYQLSTGAEDINLEAMQQLVASYNGFQFFFTFYNMSDEFNMSILVLFAWIGIFLSSEFLNQKGNGYGNYLIVRSNYKKYSRHLIIAQSLYIATILGVILSIQLIVAFIVGGADTLLYNMAGNTYYFGACVCIVGVIYILLLLYCVCINILSTACTCWVQNRYFMQAIPVLFFAIVPMLLGSTLANVIYVPQVILDSIIPFNYFTIIFRLLNTFYSMDLFALVFSLTVFLFASFLLWRHATKKMEGNYV